MKKVLATVLGLGMLAGVATNASAGPTTWTDTINWNPDVLIENTNWLGSDFSYYHDLGNAGFVDGRDTVSSYTLQVRLYDDGGRRDGDETAIIAQLGLFDADTTTEYNFNWQSVDIGWTLAGVVDINDDGTLNVWINSRQGDFYLDYSTLTASGCSPVPEPATMLLFGTGLTALAGAARRRMKK